MTTSSLVFLTAIKQFKYSAIMSSIPSRPNIAYQKVLVFNKHNQTQTQALTSVIERQSNEMKPGVNGLF